MHRSSFLALGLLLVSKAALSQTAATESSTLQALLAEVRQLRQYLQTTTVVAQRAQILLYRLQAQEAAVARAAQRLDDARSRLGEAQTTRKNLTIQLKMTEEIKSGSENARGLKELDQVLPMLKANLEALADEEQQRQTRELDAEEHLRMEQAKLTALQDQLDRLDKSLENTSEQPDRKPSSGN